MKIFRHSSGGREIIQRLCFPGEIFGVAEVSCIGPRGVCAQACADSSVIAIDHRTFHAFLRDRPDTAMLVIDVLASRLRVLGDMLIDMPSDDVHGRLMKLPARLGARYGRQRGAQLVLDIPLTHQEIADMIGTSRQTATTELGRLEREGVLRIEKHCIHIEDPGLRRSLMPEREAGVHPRTAHHGQGPDPASYGLGSHPARCRSEATRGRKASLQRLFWDVLREGHLPPVDWTDWPCTPPSLARGKSWCISAGSTA